MWVIFLDLSLINKALEVVFAITGCLMINNNVNKRLPFPTSTFVPNVAVSLYLDIHVAHTGDGCCSPCWYIPSAVLSAQETCFMLFHPYSKPT